MDPKHILTKEISFFNKLSGTTCTWISFFSLLISILFHVIAFSTNGWLIVNQESVGGHVASRDVGLWQECHEELGCRYFSISEIGHGFRSAQAFVVITFVGACVSLVYLLGYVITYNVKRDPRLVTVVAVLRSFMVLFLIMTVGVFANHWTSGLYDAAAFSGSLDYSFALETTCVFLETFGAVFAGLEVYFWMKQVDDY